MEFAPHTYASRRKASTLQRSGTLAPFLRLGVLMPTAKDRRQMAVVQERLRIELIYVDSRNARSGRFRTFH
jgi:hypothetical protein